MIIFGITVFMSCEKQELTSDPLLSPEMYLSSNLRVWYDNGGTDYGCKGTGGNCLPDIIVKPKNIKLKSANLDEKKLDYLEDSYFDKELVQLYNTGNVDIITKVKKSSTYIMIKNSKGEILQVRPFVIE